MKKRGNIFNFENISTAVILILILSLIYLLSNEKDCGIDPLCFQDELSSCSKAKLQLEQSQNIFEYKILGRNNDNCSVNVKVLKISEAADKESREIFENKEMKCYLPREVSQVSQITESQDTLSYCSGPLKEAIYELIIKRIYGTIAQNLGEIIFELREKIE